MLNWRNQKNCIDVPIAIFYTGYPKDELKAKAICSECSVKWECLKEAIETGEEFGIWGGMNYTERVNYSLKASLRAKRSNVSLQNTQREHTHLANVDSSSPERTPYLQTHTQTASPKVVVWRGLF